MGSGMGKNLDVGKISNIVAERLVAALGGSEDQAKKRPLDLWENQQSDRRDEPEFKRSRDEGQQQFSGYSSMEKFNRNENVAPGPFRKAYSPPRKPYDPP